MTATTPDKLPDEPKFPITQSWDELLLFIKTFKAYADKVRAIASAALAELAEANGKLSRLPADWDVDSGLETWFPVTATELAALRVENERLTAQSKMLFEQADGSKLSVAELCNLKGRAESAERDRDVLRAENERLKEHQACAALEGDEVGGPCVYLREMTSRAEAAEAALRGVFMQGRQKWVTRLT